MVSGFFARGKEEKVASTAMVFVSNINQRVDVLLKIRAAYLIFSMP